ncbi:hypothetical protein CTA1_3905, partial [Colletotrichum tanaceti]
PNLADDTDSHFANQTGHPTRRDLKRRGPQRQRAPTSMAQAPQQSPDPAPPRRRLMCFRALQPGEQEVSSAHVGLIAPSALETS